MCKLCVPRGECLGHPPSFSRVDSGREMGLIVPGMPRRIRGMGQRNGMAAMRATFLRPGPQVENQEIGRVALLA